MEFDTIINSLDTYDIIGEGGPAKIITHRSLEAALYQLQGDPEYGTCVDYKALAIRPDRCVFICELTDKKGRNIKSVGESSPETLDTVIAAQYPATIASNRALDKAMIRYLGVQGRVLADTEITENEKRKKQAADPPEAEGKEKIKPNKNGQKAKAEKNGREKQYATIEKKMEEYGKIILDGGKYKGRSIGEIAEMDLGYLDYYAAYAQKPDVNPSFTSLAEYLALRKELEEMDKEMGKGA